MNMKNHILLALGEVFEQWNELLAGMSTAQAIAPDLPSNWSIKDTVAHLMAWQARSIARVEGALHNREPEFPVWSAAFEPEAEADTDLVNAWIYEYYSDQSWSAVYQNWSEGFRRFLEAADRISEKDLLDGDRYAWLNGYPLAVVLLGSYDHHQEHLEKLQAWLRENRSGDLS